MKKCIFLMLLIIFPIDIMAIGICNATGAYSPYGPAGCIDPGWNSSSYSVSYCYDISSNVDTSDGLIKAMMILASSGDLGQAVCDTRALLYNTNPSAYSMFPFPWLASEEYTSALYSQAKNAYYGAPLSEDIKDKYSGSTSSIQSVSFNWESLGDVDVNNLSDKRIYARKLRLTINVNGVISDGSLTYNIGFTGSHNPFKIEFLNNPGSGNIYSNTSYIEMIVYSEEIITDLSKVQLKATVKFESKSLALYLCQGYGEPPVQRFLSISTKNNSDTFNSPIYTFDVSRTCQYKVVKDENGKETPRYELHITNPNSDDKEVQIVDAITYMSKGCCNDIEPKFFNVNTVDGRAAIEYYKNNCMFKDLVSYENNCGSTIDYVIDSETQSGKCVKQTGKKPDESYSFIWQAPIDTIIKTKLDNGNKKLKDMYNSDDLKNYYVENLSNKYCRVIASEDNEIYFPTTAVSTSGRFFVFQEDDCSGSTCFNQPRVKGKISLYIENDIDAYNKDLNDIQHKINSLNCSNPSSNASGVECNELEKQKKEILSYKNQCEENINNFDYNLKPNIVFNYTQDYLDENNKKQTEETAVNMIPNTESLKYWPKVTTNVISDKDISTYSFEKNKTYKVTFEKTVYYRPLQTTFSLLPDGYVELVESKNINNFQSQSLDIGYVYNIRTTAYPGVYNSSFYIYNLGYNQSIYDGEHSSNIDKVIGDYITASVNNNGVLYNGENALVMTNSCTYCNEEGSFFRECPTCDELDAKFIFRNIDLNDITPSVNIEKRGATNWTDSKGQAAKDMIKDINLVSKSNDTNHKVQVLNDTNQENNTSLLSNGNVYSQENLEYDITLTPNIIKEIKESNEYYDYTSFNTNDSSEYYYSCNSDMKECESSFVTKYSEMSITTETRKYKWKYFNYNKGKFEVGSIKSLTDIFTDGKYPDPYNQKDYLEDNKNWP